MGEGKVTRLQVMDPELGKDEEWSLGRAWTGDIDDPTLGLVGSVGGLTPVQGEGTLDGNPWYFRARYEHWTFTMAKPGGEPHRVRMMMHSAALEDGWNIDRPWPFGEYSAGYMPVKSALAILRACARMYRAGTLPEVKADLVKYAEEEKEIGAWFAAIRAGSYCGCGHNQPQHGIGAKEGPQVITPKEFLEQTKPESETASDAPRKLLEHHRKPCLECDCEDFAYSAEQTRLHQPPGKGDQPEAATVAS